jgi:glucan phosphoethanolaminetransferase (alkaline phosphatase superfamily)
VSREKQRRARPSYADGGCMLMLVFLPFLVWMRLADKVKIDSCVVVLVAGLASYAALAYGAVQVIS